MELWINHVQINRALWTWNDRNLAKISQKIRIKWNFELTVFELILPDLYFLLQLKKGKIDTIKILHKMIYESLELHIIALWD